MDAIFVAVLVGFFALSVGLIRFCAKLTNKGGQRWTGRIGSRASPRWGSSSTSSSLCSSRSTSN